MPDIKETTGHQQFRAAFNPQSLDREARTVDVIFATEREVYMYNWSIGRFKEVLVCDDTAGDLTRLNNGAPLCDTHDTSSVRVVLGVVVPGSARFENGKGIATIRFSKRADVDPVFNDVADGILTGISVSYIPKEYEEVDNIDNVIPTLRCTQWEGTEISLAPVQADRDSMVRGASDNIHHDVVIKRKNSNTMTVVKTDPEQAPATRTDNPVPPAGPAAPAASNDPAAEQARAAGIAEERKRTNEIFTAVRAVKLGDDFANKLVNDGTSIEESRKLIIDELAKGERATPAPHSGLKLSGDEVQNRRSAMIDGLALRSSIIKQADLKPEAVHAAREFRSMSLMDMAKDCLTRAGIDFRYMDKMEIVGRAFTSSSSDFPVLLEGVTRHILLNSYTIVADTWRRFCKVGSVSDFRENKRLRLGSFTRLDKVQENGEFKNKKITDAEAESVSVETFGNIINVTRKMIINDDLSGFADLAARLGRAAARGVEIDVYALLGSNPVMGDGKTLFHASHNNLISAGAAMSVNAFDAMRVKMASQKDKDNNDFLDMRPDILLCGIGYGGDARVLNDAVYDPSVSSSLQKPNKVRGLFKDIIDTPRITGTEYYAFADPAQEPVIEVSFLDGNQTPFLESKEGFEVDGVKWKVRSDYGVGAVGWRGAVKNPGA